MPLIHRTNRNPLDLRNIHEMNARYCELKSGRVTWGGVAYPILDSVFEVLLKYLLLLWQISAVASR